MVDISKDHSDIIWNSHGLILKSFGYPFIIPWIHSSNLFHRMPIPKVEEKKTLTWVRLGRLSIYSNLWVVATIFRAYHQAARFHVRSCYFECFNPLVSRFENYKMVCNSVINWFTPKYLKKDGKIDKFLLTNSKKVLNPYLIP